jgi:hypothetical protein
LNNHKNQSKPTSLAKKAIQIGLFAGLFWGLVWYFFHIFSFTNVGPNHLLMPFALGKWKEGVWGNLSGVIVMTILSILLAILYGAFFKKFQGVIPGVIQGLILWSILFFGIGFLSPVVDMPFELSRATLVTTICIFILHGVFIAYSVSFEASEQKLTGVGKEANYSNK